MTSHLYRHVVIVTLSAALCWATGCGSPSSVCVRNSDCSTGSYCSGGSCTHDCTAATVSTSCGPGQTCSTFGMCLAAPDGGTSRDDASTGDAGRDAAMSDAGAACVAAGGTDADGDGYCAGTTLTSDCDDTHASAHPGATEICTPSMLAAVPADEDCDGEIDNGCAWAFGVAQFMTQTSTFHDQWLSPSLSEDGLRVYFTGFGSHTSALFMASRPALDQPFANAVPVPLSGGDPPDRSAVRHDELEIFFGQCGHGLWRATRAHRTDAFGAATAVPDTGALCDPSLSADGLELFHDRFLTEGLELHVMRRPSVTEAFGAAVRLTMTGSSIVAMGAPELAPDGRTLFFSEYPTGRLFVSHRADTTSTTFAIGREIAELGSRYTMAFSSSGSEMFMAGGNSADWSSGLYRVRVCRDGACPLMTAVACPSEGRRSPDNFHCYTRGATNQPYGNAVSACATPGDARLAHLVSIHSEAERAFVWHNFGTNTALSGTLWLGASDMATEGTWIWVSGEPFNYVHWGGGDPNEGTAANGLALWWAYDGLFADEAASHTYNYVCETELWPSW